MKKLKNASIILAIVVFVFFYIYSDYKWAEGAISAYADEGWDVVASTSDNYIDIAAPWQIFKAPISRIAFLRSDNIMHLDQQYIITDVLWVDNGSDRTAEQFHEIYDCENNKSAYIDDTADIETLDFSSLEWHEFSDDTPGYQVFKKICGFKK